MNTNVTYQMDYNLKLEVHEHIGDHRYVANLRAPYFKNISMARGRGQGLEGKSFTQLYSLCVYR
jgi:predicted HD phosphohydrolase